MSKLSAADLRVLRVVQENAQQSRQAMAAAAGMSPTTFWRRMGELEASGAIRRHVTLLDPQKVGVPVCVFLSINLKSHEETARNAFETFIDSHPMIMECFAVTGGFDYVMIVRTRSIADFEAFLMDRILRHPSVASASSQISLRQHKYTTELPLE